jgi:DNA-binding GntR family transcriptional regulator
MATQAPSKHRLNRQSLPDALARSLQERILNGEFKEGDALIQEAIAAEYECSRMPVREAFRQLEATGLVVSKIHKGFVVTSLPVEQITELFELRAILECDILSRAIPKMTSEDIDASQLILNQLETSYRERDMSRWGALNFEFHKSLYVPADRVQTMGLIQSINIQTDRYIRLQLLLTDAFKDAEVEHRHLLKLCSDGDVKAAIPYLKKHILNAGNDLLAALKEKRSGEKEAVRA